MFANDSENQAAPVNAAHAGDLRCMFYNIYGYGDNPKQNVYPGPMELRQEQQEVCIGKYAPDVVGLQEYDRQYRAGMAPRMAALGYREVPIDDQGGFLYPVGKNCEPLFYRPDRLECLCSGGELYPDAVEVDGAEVLGNNGHSKSLTWAVFRERQTGRRFIAVCTHFMWSAPELTFAQAEAVRVDNADRLLRKIEEIRAMHPDYAGLPAVMGGDLNCEPDSPAFRQLDRSMEWCYQAASGHRDNLGCPGYPTFDSAAGAYTDWGTPAEGRSVIDYIWVQNPGEGSGMAVRDYFTVTDREALLSSDHCPKVADIVLQ